MRKKSDQQRIKENHLIEELPIRCGSSSMTWKSVDRNLILIGRCSPMIFGITRFLILLPVLIAMHESGAIGLPFSLSAATLQATTHSTESKEPKSPSSDQAQTDAKPQEAATSPSEKIETARAQFKDKLKTFAAKCGELGMTKEQAIVESWVVSRDPQRMYLFLPPPTDPFLPADDAPKNVKSFYKAWSKLRGDFAEQLFEGTYELMLAGDTSEAYRLLNEVLVQNPDHAKARSILGYVKGDGIWIEDGNTKTSSSKHKVKHRALPNLPVVDFNTTHFRILSTADLPQIQKLAEDLELGYDLWRQVFVGYWADKHWLKKRWDGDPSTKLRRTKHVVIVYLDRQQYIDQLSPHVPGVERSIGFYDDSAKESFFYFGDELTESTIRHELTHQLCQEVIPTRPDATRGAGIWLMEGIAMYMESLRHHGQYATLGGFDTTRLQFARLRRFREGFRPDLEQALGFDRNTLQEQEEIANLYSLYSAISHLLMSDKAPGSREKTMSFLRELYTSRAPNTNFFGYMETTPERLEQQLVESLAVGKESFRQFFVPDDTKELVLVPSNFDDSCATLLTKAASLSMLDLTSTQITDRSLRTIGGLAAMRQLFLGDTRISDQGLIAIEPLQELRQLDLSRTTITDEGLKSVGKLTKLMILDLQKTKVTDAGLTHLESLTELESLRINETAITPAAFEQLQAKLPRLKLEE
jgi:Leucine Rich repeat